MERAKMRWDYAVVGDEDAATLTDKAEGAQRIVVALDASPHSYAALEAAARLSRLIGAELHGLFIEDHTLHQIGAFPFSAEVGAYSATARALTQRCIPRELHVLQEAVQRRMQRVATQMQVSWRFEVIQGGVTNELINAAAGAAILSMGRSGWSKSARLGSTAERISAQLERPLLLASEKVQWRNRITTLFTASPASMRALQQAARLALQAKSELTVQVSSAELGAQAAHMLAAMGVQAHVRIAAPLTDIGQQLWLIKEGLLVLPKDMAQPLKPLLAILKQPILLVP